MVDSETLAKLLLPTGHILQKETMHVVPGHEYSLNHFEDSLIAELEGVCSNQRGVHEVEADGVRAVLFDDFHGGIEVIFALGHLISVFG